MSLEEKINEDIKKAMLAKEKEKLKEIIKETITTLKATSN